MAKRLISLIKESISDMNNLRYFGDVVVYASNDSLGKGLEFFMEDEFTHCALRTGKNKAEGARLNWKNLIPFKKKQNIIRYHNLGDPLDEYDTYLILRHKKINIFKRMKMKKIYAEMEIQDYDFPLFLKKAFKHSARKIKRFFRYNDNERAYSTDVSRIGSYLCGSQTDYTLFEVSLESEQHWSQIEPHHFLKDENFEVVERGYRTDGKWEREKIKPEKVTSYMQSFYTSHQQSEQKRQSK